MKQTVKDVGFEIASDVSVDGDNFSKKVIANPGDVLTLRLKYKNIGHPFQKQIVCRDRLPRGIEYIEGTTTFRASYRDNVDGPLRDNLFAISGMNMGDFKLNEWMIITYKTKVADDTDAFKDCSTTVHNDASVATANGTGYVKVEIVVNRQEI